MQLITMNNNEPTVSAITIADNTNNQYGSIRDLITKFSKELKEFGELRVTDLKSATDTLGRKNKTKTVALLNETQAIFIMTLLKNSSKVVRFKLLLVKEFYRLKHSQETQDKINYSKGFINNDWDFNRKIEFLLKQTQIELKNEPKKETLLHWAQERTSYFITYVKALRAGGSELQMFASNLIYEAQNKRNEAENRYANLKAKYESFGESVRDMKKSIEIMERELGK